MMAGDEQRRRGASGRCDGVRRSRCGAGRVSVRQVEFLAPVRLEQDAVDLFELDDFGAIAHGLEQRAEAEVSGFAQAAFRGADDEAERVIGEGAVPERGLVELRPYESAMLSGASFLSKTEQVTRFFRSSLTVRARELRSSGWATKTSQWFFGKSSKSRRILSNAVTSIRWASSMMGASILLAAFRRRASAMRRRSQRTSCPSASILNASHRMRSVEWYVCRCD
jgi:hypothetical protein